MTTYDNDSNDTTGIPAEGRPVTTDATPTPPPVVEDAATSTQPPDATQPIATTPSDQPRAVPPPVQPTDPDPKPPKAIAPNRELAGLEVEVERKKPSLNEVRAKLEKKNEDIKAQVEAIQDEVSTLGDLVKDTVRNKPLLVLGGLAAAGVLVGLWVGGWGKRRAPKLPRKQQRLVDAYVKEANSRIKRGEIDADDPRVGRMMPLLYAPKVEAKRESGVFKTLVSTTVRVGLGIAIQKGLEHLADGAGDLDEVPEETIAAAEAAPPISEV